MSSSARFTRAVTRSTVWSSAPATTPSTTNFRYSISGSGDAQFAGRATQLAVTISGRGSFDGEQQSYSITAGKNFAEGRGNISLNGNFTWRTAQRPSDRDYTATQDLRPLFAGFADYAASSAPDNRGCPSSGHLAQMGA